MKTDRLTGLLALCLFDLELLLILGSWMVEAAAPEWGVRSLISYDGVRWLLGSFADTVSTPLLVWLVVVAVACGAAKESGLAHVVRHRRPLQYRERLGLGLVASELVLMVVVMVLLTCLPHALLLNTTGHLYPGPFTESLVPLAAFTLLVCALSYGATSGRLSSLAQLSRALTSGLRLFAPAFPVYLLLMQLIGSIKFILSIQQAI